MTEAAADRRRLSVDPRIVLAALVILSAVVIHQMLQDGTHESPYERRSNVGNYYGDCPSSPVGYHVWHDQDAWYKISFRSAPVHGSVAICFFCGAHIA